MKPAWLRLAFGEQHADRGDRLVALVEDRRRHRHQRLQLGTTEDGHPLPAHLGERAPYHRGRNQRLVRLAVQRPREQFVLHLGRCEGEERQPHAGRVQRHLAADPVPHVDRPVRRETLDQRRLKTVADRELHVLVRDRSQVAHEGQSRLAQTVTARGE